MKQFKNFSKYVLAAFMIISLNACINETGTEIIPPVIEDILGVEESYTIDQFSTLTITPNLEIENESEVPITYEWSINSEVVSTEEVLVYNATKLGEFTGFLKVSASTYASKLFPFTIRVESVDFNKGILLLSSTSEGSMLSFKNVSEEKMGKAVNVDVFKSLNPGLELGKKALSVAWMGNSLTNVGENVIDKDTDLDIYVSTGEPTKVYAINPETMLSKAEVTYNGSASNFQPNYLFIPKGFQNSLWLGTIYFLGDGRDYIMAINDDGSREFVDGDEWESLPEGAKIAEMAYTGVGNYGPIRSYFNLTTKSFIQMEAAGTYYDGSDDGMGGTVEMNNFDVTPMNILPCDGEYYSSTDGDPKSYDAWNMLLIGYNGENVTVFQVKPMDAFADFGDAILSTSDATGHITKTSATGVNPIKPLLYYSTADNKIGVVNYTSASFNDTYIDLGGNYEVKDIVFNTYDTNTMYVAANNLDETSELKATIFVYDITDPTTAKLLFKGEKAGGSVKQLVYKGNGSEYKGVE